MPINIRRLSSVGTAVLLAFGLIVIGCSERGDEDKPTGIEQTGLQTDHSARPDSGQLDSMAPAGQSEPMIQNIDLRTEPGSIADGIEAANETVALKTVNKSGFEEALKRHRGKVVFVDFWGTWCPNCIKRFPHTVALHHKYQSDGLRVISLALELEPLKTKDNALDQLKKQKATFDNLLSDEPLEDAVNTLNLTGALPEYWLLGRDGKLLRRFTNEDPDHPINDAEIDKAIRNALGLQ